jgi:hypothetical protein
MSANRPQTEDGKARAAFIKRHITREEYKLCVTGDLWIEGAWLVGWAKGAWHFERIRKLALLPTGDT